MLSSFLSFLIQVDSFFWAHIAFVLILGLGVYYTFRARFFQVRALPEFFKTFYHFLRTSPANRKGVHPVKLFFASVGGMVGIGNIVGIVTALQIGGPGALFWIWITALFGSIIKYAEIFLGLKYRIANDHGSYDGGPIYFLKAAFKTSVIPAIVAVLLCIYGVEIYQFTILTDCISTHLSIHRWIAAASLLILVFFAALGGVRRIAQICSFCMPVFVICYFIMGGYILIREINTIPALLQTIIQSAFQGHAALGGFAGGGVLLAIQHGIARSAYSSDLGIGYDSIIQSESSSVYPEKQASLSIIGVLLDNLICSLSVLIVLVTGLWTSSPPIPSIHIVQQALSLYFPYMNIFMPLFLFMTGYTTVIAYFCVGLKCARFLAPNQGKRIYSLYGGIAFMCFAFFDSSIALLVMSISGALLLIINLFGIIRLRNEVSFNTSSLTKEPYS